MKKLPRRNLLCPDKERREEVWQIPSKTSCFWRPGSSYENTFWLKGFCGSLFEVQNKNRELYFYSKKYKSTP